MSGVIVGTCALKLATSICLSKARKCSTRPNFSQPQFPVTKTSASPNVRFRKVCPRKYVFHVPENSASHNLGSTLSKTLMRGPVQYVKPHFTRALAQSYRKKQEALSATTTRTVNVAEAKPKCQLKQIPYWAIPCDTFHQEGLVCVSEYSFSQSRTCPPHRWHLARLI